MAAVSLAGPAPAIGGRAPSTSTSTSTSTSIPLPEPVPVPTRASVRAGVEPDAADDRAPGDVADRRIAGEGTPERDWQRWPGLAALPATTAAELVPAGRRAVVLAPHPDDELLGCGGTLAQLARAGREVLVVGVTDGEASHPGSTRLPPAVLAAARCDERERGLRALGLPGDCVRLGLADGGVTAAEDALADALQALLRPGDVVLATWRLDGHPDHEAVGRAAARAARAAGCPLHEMPVWMWHWAAPGDARVPWHRLARVPMDAPTLARKRAAVAAHASQLAPDDTRPPVLPHWALARVLRPAEVFFVDGTVPSPPAAGPRAGAEGPSAGTDPSAPNPNPNPNPASDEAAP